MTTSLIIEDDKSAFWFYANCGCDGERCKMKILNISSSGLFSYFIGIATVHQHIHTRLCLVNIQWSLKVEILGNLLNEKKQKMMLLSL